MNFDDLNFISTFTFEQVLILLFKAFAVLSSVMYLVYSIVVFRQTELMNRTLVTRHSWVFVIIAVTQIVLGLFLLFISLVYI